MSGQIGGSSLAAAMDSLVPFEPRAKPIGDTEYRQRTERARALLRQHGGNALLLTAGASLRYFSGIPWGASERLVAMLITLDGDPLVPQGMPLK
ncbi:proline dipeptidase [Rhodanobacter sp. 115]|nr:proline dipeptidase [Rhodanobacter sp. 115]